MKFLFGTILLIGGILYSFEGFQIAFANKEINKTFVLLSSIVAALAFYNASFDFLKKYKFFKTIDKTIELILVKFKILKKEKNEIEEIEKNETVLQHANIKINFRRDNNQLYYQTTCLCGHQKEKLFNKKANEPEKEKCPNCGSSIDITFYF